MNLSKTLGPIIDGKQTDVVVALSADDVAFLQSEPVRYERQRDLDERHVADLADVMTAEEWLSQANRLIFAPNGSDAPRLVDGQHRLAGYAKYLRDGGDPLKYTWSLGYINEDANTVYGRLDALGKKRPHSVVARTMGLPDSMKLLRNVELASGCLRDDVSERRQLAGYVSGQTWCRAEDSHDSLPGAPAVGERASKHIRHRQRLVDRSAEALPSRKKRPEGRACPAVGSSYGAW